MIYYAEYESGYIGGIALVSAPNPEDAANILNARLAQDPMAKQKVEAKDMKKFNNVVGNCVILSNGDY